MPSVVVLADVYPNSGVPIRVKCKKGKDDVLMYPDRGWRVDYVPTGKNCQTVIVATSTYNLAACVRAAADVDPRLELGVVAHAWIKWMVAKGNEAVAQWYEDVAARKKMTVDEFLEWHRNKMPRGAAPRRNIDGRTKLAKGVAEFNKTKLGKKRKREQAEAACALEVDTFGDCFSV